MVLEQVFRCPKTRARLQCGPLGRLLEGFCLWLLDGGFTRACIRRHLANLSHLNAYLGTAALPRETFSSQDIEGFLKAYRAHCRNRGPLEAHLCAVRSSINRFIAYLRPQGLFDLQGQAPIYQPLLDEYLAWLRDHHHAACGTLELRGHCLTELLRWLGPQASAEGLAALNAEQVEGFFLAAAQGKGQAARRSMQAALRTFLRFCFQQGYLHQRLDRAIPTLRTYKLSKVPRGLSEAQAQRVLESVERRTPVGRRDYAILQLLHTYGVRGGQVRTLRLEDIRWADNQILFRASKYGKDTLLPLTLEVGEALLDYLRNARPRGGWPHVFLTCRAPYHPLEHPNTVAQMVCRRLRSAGIQLPSQGAHAFRHGFATRMLAQGHSLKAIADVLGQRHLATTFLYTKVDFRTLESVALPWPQEPAP